MTVNLVYGDSSDGYLHSFDAAYATARNGPADGANTGASAYFGQNNNGGTYAVFQTFIRFAWAALPAGSIVTAAAIRASHATNLSTGTARDMEVRGFDWSGGGLTVADWQTPTNLTARTLFAVVRSVQSGTTGKVSYSGSEGLRGLVASVTSANFVVVSSRQRAGSTPASDEGSSIFTAEAGGTGDDPLLIFTTVPTHGLIPCAGAEVQLSDGTWVFGVRPPGESRVLFYREDFAGSGVYVGEIPFGATSTTWADVQGSQGVALAVDAQDNFYVVGRAGDAQNSLRVRAYAKAPGSWSWTAGTTRTVPLPAHDAPVNNVTACWHSTAGGTLAVFAAHTVGDGVSAGNTNDLAYALLDSTYLLTGAGTLTRTSGSALSAGLGLASLAANAFNGYANETGSGLNVVADRTQPDWGYLASFKRGQDLGENASVIIGRYILNATATGFSHASYETASVYGVKDAAAKLRLLAVGSGQVALVTADADTGYGISVQVLQASGTTPGFVSLGSAFLAGESITTMPDGPAVAVTSKWDATYSAVENAVWIYYVDVGNAARVMRTSVSMNTYQATRVAVQVITGVVGVIHAIRTPSNSWAAQKGHVTLGLDNGYSRIVDTFNLVPLAPTLTPQANYDATTAATFAWTFNDPNTGDTQSAYQLQVQRVDTGATVLDTGKTASTTPSRNVAGGTLTNGLDYRWRVMTWDALDAAGAWSDWGTFTASAAGSVNILTPAADNPPGVVTDDYLVSWSVTGTVQASYRAWVTRNDTGVTVHDSGWVTSSATSATVAGMVTDVEHTIRVQVRNASAVSSGIGSRLITPSYGTPETPLVTLVPVPDGGYVLVDVDNPIPGEVGSGFPFYDFEPGADLTPFFKSGGTLVLTSAQAYRGAQSAVLTSTGTGAAQVYHRAPAVNVAPGQRYAVRAWLYAPVARNVSITIDWLTTGGAYVSSSGTTLALAAGTWTAIEAAGNCPATASKASYGWALRDTPSAGAELYGDDLRLAPSSDRPEVIRNRVLRRLAGTTDPWEVLGTCDPDGDFRDYTVPSQVPVEYMVRGESA